jgi:phosphate:Na+ symporter
MNQWSDFRTHILKIEDDEIGLLAFQTAINTFGLILMFPFFNSISKLLDHIFKENKDRSTLYLSKIENTANEATIDALEKETKLFIFRTLLTNLLVFKVDKKELELEKEMDSALEIFIKSDANHPNSYLNLKIAEGKILSFISEITETDKRNKDFKRFSMLISVIKHAMYAAKGIKDVVKDQEELQKSSKNEKYQHFELLQSQIIDLYKSMCRLMKNHKNENVYIELEKLLNKIQLNFQAGMNDVQTSISTKKINELEVSTLFNIDREMYSSGKAMIFAIKDYFLDAEAADKLENLPAPIFYHVSKNSVKTADDAYQI